MLKNKHRTCIFLLLSVMVSEFVVSEQLPRAATEVKKQCELQLSLDSFRAHALRNSPLVADIDKAYAEGLAKAFETATLTNPELSVSQTHTSMQLDGDNDAQSELIISQPLNFSDFGTKTRVAELIRKVSNFDKRAELLAFTQKIHLHFYTLVALRNAERVLFDAYNRAVKKASNIKDGLQKGLYSTGEAQLFEGEKFKLEAQQKSFRSMLLRAQFESVELLGTSCTPEVEASTKLAPLPPESALLERASTSELSKKMRLQLATELATERVDLANLDRLPRIAPRLVYEHTNDGGDFAGLGISFSLPLWNRNQAERLRARSEYEASKKESELAEKGGLEREIVLLRELAENAREQAELYASKVVPSFQEALTFQEKRYAEGRGDILQLWQTSKVVNEAHAEALSHWLEAIKVRSQLSLLIGEEL